MMKFDRENYWRRAPHYKVIEDRIIWQDTVIGRHDQLNLTANRSYLRVEAGFATCSHSFMERVLTPQLIVEISERRQGSG